MEQLGLEVLGEGPDHSNLLLGNQVLGLRDLPKGARGGGVDHLALRVTDWTGLRNRVRRARIEVQREKERDDSRSLFLKGPDGLRVRARLPASIPRSPPVRLAGAAARPRAGRRVSWRSHAVVARRAARATGRATGATGCSQERYLDSSPRTNR